MREPRIYTDQILESGSEIQLEPASSHHLLKVLRLRPGAALRLFNGDGREFRALLREVSGGAVSARVEDQEGGEPLPTLELNLLLGISKGERMEFAIRKAVELGVTGITPVFTARSVVRLQGERLQKRMEHWLGLVISACEQSGRCRLPLLAPARSLDKAVAGTGSDLRLLLHPQGESGLNALAPPQRGIDLLIGPEGGLEESEIARARAHGFTPVRLGPRIMRTETAPLAALAAIQMLWGDFRGG